MLEERLAKRFGRMEPEGDGWSHEWVTDELIRETIEELASLRERLVLPSDVIFHANWRYDESAYVVVERTLLRTASEYLNSLREIAMAPAVSAQTVDLCETLALRLWAIANVGDVVLAPEDPRPGEELLAYLIRRSDGTPGSEEVREWTDRWQAFNHPEETAP